MASTEEKAYEIMRELDVSYVLVIFGGLTGYSSDGENSFTAMQMWIGRVSGVGGEDFAEWYPLPGTCNSEAENRHCNVSSVLEPWCPYVCPDLVWKISSEQLNFCNQTWYGDVSSWARVSCEIICLLYPSSEWGLHNQNTNFDDSFWTNDSFAAKLSVMVCILAKVQKFIHKTD